MATESSSTAQRFSYDVFLSFRGSDTRQGFTSHLHAALCRHHVLTFVDHGLMRGEEVAPTLMKAIEESRVSVIVFSKNYASSRWCLDELVKICECVKNKGQSAVPVFYLVDPSDVRNQTGCFAQAFAKHEEDFKDSPGKVHNWRVALSEAANRSGWDSAAVRSESKLVEHVVSHVLNLLQTSTTDPCGFIGLDSHIEQLESLLCLHSSDVPAVVGIWGVGGIGKTTIARAVFERISSRFQCSSFMEDIRDKFTFQQKILSQLLGCQYINTYPCSLKDAVATTGLCFKKVLIVLDDLDWTNVKEIESPRGLLDCFGLGTRIIVTSRDQALLTSLEVDIRYHIKGLNSREALSLFSSHAFKKVKPEGNYRGLSDWFVKYTAGNPLALKVLGSHLSGRSKQYWESTSHKLQNFPRQAVQDALKMSFDDLDDEEKEVFLDIACFFEGMDIDYVSNILEGYGYAADIGIASLEEKSLVTISGKKLALHSLVQEMAHEIVRQESGEPRKRSRLWSPDDVSRALSENVGAAATEGISLDLSKMKHKLHLSATAFKGMYNLRFIRFYDPLFEESPKVLLPQGFQTLSHELRYFQWSGFPLKSLPSNFIPDNLVELRLPHSKVQKLWTGVQSLANLKWIDLSYSKHLTEIPNLSRATNLETLNLHACTRLRKVSTSIQYLNKLSVLHLGDCKELRTLPRHFHSEYLKKLILSGCSKAITHTSFLPDAQHSSLSEVGGRNLPSQFILEAFILSTLTVLSIGYCNLIEIPDGLGTSSSLESLDLSGNYFKHLPASIRQLCRLRFLYLCECKKLQSIPELPSSIEILRMDNCISLTSVSFLHITLDTLKWLSTRQFMYINCISLDGTSRVNILQDAELRIQSMAFLSAAAQVDCQVFSKISICLPGSEIPGWFTHQATGSKLIVCLPPNWCNSKFVGFALCVVIGEQNLDFEDEKHNLDEIEEEEHNVDDFVHLEFSFRGINQYHDVDNLTSLPHKMESEHILLWYRSTLNGKAVKGGDFRTVESSSQRRAPFQFSFYDSRGAMKLNVKKCGVSLLYSEGE